MISVNGKQEIKCSECGFIIKFKDFVEQSEIIYDEENYYECPNCMYNIYIDLDMVITYKGYPNYEKKN